MEGAKPSAKTGMLIRKPAPVVFEAFADPEITTKFWFTKSTGRLAPDARVEWTWAMYGVSSPVVVKSFDPGERIVVEWPGPTTVEWTFKPMDDGATFVEITHAGFTGDPADVLKQVAGSTEGFALVLAGAKALLEHGIRLNLVGDRFPGGLGGSA